MLKNCIVNRRLSSLALFLPLSVGVLIFTSSCTQQAPSPPAPEETPTTENSPPPAPIATPSRVVGPCERTFIEVVDSLQTKTEEALVRYAHTKRIPSRENFRLTYIAFQEAQGLLRLLSERYPSTQCEVSQPPSPSRKIEASRLREETLAQIASPLAFIEENRLN